MLNYTFFEKNSNTYTFFCIKLLILSLNMLNYAYLCGNFFSSHTKNVSTEHHTYLALKTL